MKTRQAKEQPSAKAKLIFGRVAQAHTQPGQHKSHLSARELRGFREKLPAKRCELVGDADRLCDDAVGGGRNSFEQGLTLGLAENTTSLLCEIDAALRRINDGTYGTCEETGKPISKARLRAIPWTRYCIAQALKLEAG